jgi:hypothetical protein
MGRPNALCEGPEQRVSSVDIHFPSSEDDVCLRYINHKNQPIVERLFPNMKLEALDAGHWGRSISSYVILR